MSGTGDTVDLDRLLAGWGGKADAAALDAAMPLVYLELKSIATQALRAHSGNDDEKVEANIVRTMLRFIDK